MLQAESNAVNAPIGVFDSGVGGLSVLRALLDALPHESFVYVGDSGHAPYGERDDAHVLQRAQVITEHLTRHYHIKALVVACNTATAAAVQTLRARWRELAIVGMEPPLKPAAAGSVTGVVGVMATRGTLQSEKFSALLDQLKQSSTARFVLQACDGLADAIEHNDESRILTLCTEYTAAMGSFGAHAGAMDALVLGCTHYPFVADTLRTLVGRDVVVWDAGAPVARRTAQVLDAAGLRNGTPGQQSVQCITSGEERAFRDALLRWLPEVSTSVTRLALDPA